MIASTAPIIHKPPAPAPPWVNTPLMTESPDTATGLYFYPLIFITIMAGITIFYKFWRTGSDKTKLKVQEQKLRHQIGEYLGPEAQWLSADEIGKRFQTISKKPENHLGMISELDKIERLRFMK